MAKLLAAHRRPLGRDGAAARHRAAVLAILGEDWVKAEKRYEQLCDTVDPGWACDPGWTAWGCGWNIGPQRSLLVGTADAGARVTTLGERMRGSYVMAARAEFGPGRACPLSFWFGRDDKGSTVVAWFNKGLTGISIFDQGKFESKVHAEVPIEVGVPFDLRVEVTGKEVCVLVNGKAACVWPHGGRDVHTRPFVEVFDRIVWLEGLRFETLPQDK